MPHLVPAPARAPTLCARLGRALLALALLLVATPTALAAPIDDAASAFEARTGARLLFARGELPSGEWYDELPVLSRRRQLRAARLLLGEAEKYPRGFLGAIGVEAVGVFAACVSDTNDGYHSWNDRYDGYLYYGVWNGKSGIAAAYYTDGQLPLTFHHEVFHAVDAARGGVSDRAANFTADDARFAAAVRGDRPYPAARIAAADLKRLTAIGRGRVLEEAVARYAGKNVGEDQAETARWMLTNLPDALVQMARRPALAGSQRMLHLIGQYAAATERGPGLDWFVDVALGRAGGRQAAAAPDPDVARLTPHGRLAGAATAVSRPAAAAAPARHGRPAPAHNPYLHKVDEKIGDPRIRAAIRAVQPAAVKLGGGSGVNLAPEGLVLTNAHVAKRVGARFTVLFPDGRAFTGRAIALDDTLDLALLSLAGAEDLPIAPVARRAPRVGDFVAIIGQPGTTTPNGEPTGYQRWHVSTGKIRGFLDDPLGDQSLGRTKHDAWTYWGHSGSPLFNRYGAIIALHNSWDSTTAMRHAVTWQAVVHFLEEHDAHYASR